MTNISWAFFAVFILVSVFHIFAIALRKEKMRRASKCLVMPLLIAVYIAAGKRRGFFPIPALALGWVGDVLLIKIEKKTHFMLGLASFLLGHVFYIIAFMHLLGFFTGGNAAGSINAAALLIFTPSAAVLGMVVFRLIKPTKEMFIPVILYMAVLVTMNLLGFQVSLFYPGAAGLLIVSGCFNFIVSDTLLAYYTFRKLKLLGAVLIMVYYLLAQAEIIMGLLAISPV